MLSMTIMFIAITAFAGIVAYAFWPSAKDKFDAQGESIFTEDGSAASGNH